MLAWVWYLGFWVQSFVFFWCLNRDKRNFLRVSPFLFVFGAASRVVCFLTFPTWEDDWARYLWEGILVRNQTSPYKYPPELFFYSVTNESLIQLLSQVNHPDWTSIYHPLVLLFFSLSTFFPSVLGIRFLYLSLELFFYFWVWKYKRRDFDKVFLLWIFPLFWYETYHHLHFEIFLLILVYFFFYFVKNKKDIWAGFIFGIGFHWKVFFFCYLILTILPSQNSGLFLQRTKAWFRRVLFSFPSFVLGYSLGFLLFFIWIPDPQFPNLFKTLQSFGSEFDFNPFWNPFHWGTLGFRIQQVLVLCFFLGWYCYRLRKEKIPIPAFASFVYFLLVYFFFVSLPVVNPWYFLVLLPFLWNRFPWSWKAYFLLSIPSLSYLTGPRLGLPSSSLYEVPEMILALEWGLSIFCLFSLSRK